LNRDNEEDAVLAIKIMTDLHKNPLCKLLLAPYVQPFFDFVIDIYSDFSKLLLKYFKLGSPIESNDDTVMEDARDSEEDDESKKSKKRIVLVPSKDSFKVLTEIPIVLVLLFQSYQDIAKKNIKAVVTRMIESFTVSVVPPTPNSANRQHYLDLISARVKVCVYLIVYIQPHTNFTFSDCIIPHLCNSYYTRTSGEK
jgi:hypothetical protein